MQLMRVCGTLLLLTSLTACSSKSAGDELAKELIPVKSWAATAHMVADAWLQGNVPTPYAKKTLSTAQKELHKKIDTITKSSPNSTPQIIDQIQQLESTVGQMSTAVEQQNKTAIASEIQQLSIQEQAIASLETQQVSSHE